MKFNGKVSDVCPVCGKKIRSIHVNFLKGTIAYNHRSRIYRGRKLLFRETEACMVPIEEVENGGSKNP